MLWLTNAFSNGLSTLPFKTRTTEPWKANDVLLRTYSGICTVCVSCTTLQWTIIQWKFENATAWNSAGGSCNTHTLRINFFFRRFRFSLRTWAAAAFTWVEGDQTWAKDRQAWAKPEHAWTEGGPSLSILSILSRAEPEYPEYGRSQPVHHTTAPPLDPFCAPAPVSWPILLGDPFCSPYYYKSQDLTELPQYNMITIIWDKDFPINNKNELSGQVGCATPHGRRFLCEAALWRIWRR
jgi:hypothetical protein